VVSLSGPIALDTIDKVNIDTAFIGAAGFSAEHGFTNALYNECELKKKVISEAKRIIVLLDSRKFHKSLPYTFANISDIDILVTNQALPPDLQQLCQGHGVRVIA